MRTAPSDRRRRLSRTAQRLLSAEGRAMCESLEERKLLATFVVDSLDTNNDGDRTAGNFALIEAVADANANPGADEIVFSESLAGMQLDVPSALNIGGETVVRGPTTGIFTISGQSTTRIFDINDGNGSDAAVLIQDLTLINGNAGVEVGGAIRSSEALTLQNVIIRGSSGVLGGAIYLADGSLVADATTIIENNTATTAGGGIFANNSTTVTLNGSVVRNNTADGGGGGINGEDDSTITLTNATVTGNSVTAGSGGGISQSDGTAIVLTTTTVSNNTASGNGGGLYLVSTDSITISNSTISGNMATSSGGGILASMSNGGTLSIVNTALSTNMAGDSGGGLDLAMSTSGAATLTNTTFMSNQATGSAGGMRIITAGTSTAIVTDSTFTSNTAGVDGGGIMSLAETLTVTGTSFSMNAADQGGGIASNHAGGKTIRIEDSTFTGNTAADNGGGIYARKPFATSSADPTVHVIGSTVTGNNATAGGGIYISGDENTGVVVETSDVSSNTASSIGGGIMLTGINDEISFAFTLTDSTVSNNRANTLDGGGIFSTAGTLTITDSTISGNTAARDGGGLHDASTTGQITDSDISDNTATIRGGGFYKARSGVTGRFTSSLISGNLSSTSDGGGIYFRGSQFFLSNSTVSGNTGSFGGGIRLDQTPNVRINNSTITNNTARGEFGGIGATSAPIDLTSTILAGNSDADATNPDVDVTTLSANNNNLINTDPILTALGDFGGPTRTHMPMQGSTAINAGINDFGLTEDARGFSRDDGGGIDIGATEAYRPTVTLGAQTVSIANRAVVINVTAANDVDGTVSGIRVYRDANSNGIADTGELIDTIMIGGTVTLPVEQLPVGTSDLLLIPVDNTGLLGSGSTGSVTLQAVPGFDSVTLLDFNNNATTSVERDRMFTINATSPVFSDAAGSILAFEVFVDRNGNLVADDGELLGQGAYTENATGSGTVQISRAMSATLPLGTSTLLIRPLTSRPGAEADGPISTMSITVSPARTAGEGSEVVATAASNLHSVLAVAGDGSPLLFEQASNGTWTARRLDDATGFSANFGTQTEIWSNAAGLTRAAVLTDTSLIVFTEQADGTFTATDLGATVAGSTPIARALTSFTTLGGRVYLAGYTASDRLVAYLQPTVDSAAWQFEDISADLDGRGFATPVLDEIVSYVTAWNQWSIVGLDTNGDVQNIWVLPGTFEEWTLSNLSEITGAPDLASGLSVILTNWRGINLTALDSSGNLLVTWWVPAFGGDWVSSDLSQIADDSGAVDDRVIVEVMTGYITSWSGMNYAGVNAEGDLIIYWWVPAFEGQWLVSQITDGATSNGYDPMEDVSSFVTPEGTLNVVGADDDGDVLRSSWRPGAAEWTTEVLSDIATFI